MRTYKDALNEFMESREFESMSDPLSLEAPVRMRQYLQNRLKHAFDAGWKMRENMPKESSDNG